MKIGIIAAMPQELKILVEALQNGEKHLRLGKGLLYRVELVAMKWSWLKVVSEKSCQAMSVAVFGQRFLRWKPLSIQVLQVQ